MKNLNSKKSQRYLQKTWHLLRILAMKDQYTYIHSKNTAEYSVAFARALDLSYDMVTDMYIAGWLHDIGKLYLPTDLLQKPAALTTAEYDQVKKHVQYGLDIVAIYKLPPMVINSIKYHHERFDGLGYPFQISGADTPLEGRIIQITDAYSAITNKRVYRNPLSLSNAIDELEQNSGTQFDPELLPVFIRILMSRGQRC
ncbi:MAG: HD-GYP domain-containing protein [Methanobacterium sp.]